VRESLGRRADLPVALSALERQVPQPELLRRDLRGHLGRRLLLS